MPAFPGVATVIAPGSTVSDVEDRVLEPLEETVNEMEEVDEIQATALPGVGVIMAEFREDVDTEEAYDLFVQRISALQPRIARRRARGAVLRGQAFERGGVSNRRSRRCRSLDPVRLGPRSSKSAFGPSPT